MVHANEDLLRDGYALFGNGDISTLKSRFFADGHPVALSRQEPARR